MALYDVALSVPGYETVKHTREGNSGRLIGQELLREAEAELDAQLDEYELVVGLASPKRLGLTPTVKGRPTAPDADKSAPA